MLVLIMSPTYNEKVIIEHGGEKMEIVVRRDLESEKSSRIRLGFNAPLTFKIYREKEKG